MNKDIVNLLSKKYFLLVVVAVVLVLIVYFLFITEDAPTGQTWGKFQQMQTLKTSVANSRSDLERIINDNKNKQEAAKSATIKEFYNSPDNDFSPMLNNITTYIKQNGLRMKSIKVNNDPDDNLIKNGMGAYSGSRIDFELVGSYPQYATLLNDLNSYPYFISISKFDIKPYQYNKKILISNISITLYAKR